VALSHSPAAPGRKRRFGHSAGPADNTDSEERPTMRSNFVAVIAQLTLLPSASVNAFLSCPRTEFNLGLLRMASTNARGDNGYQMLDRRGMLPLISFVGLSLNPSKSQAEDDQSSSRAKVMAKQLAAVQFTGEIDRASERASILAQRGDFAGAEKQWNAVIDAYDKNAGKIVLSPQAIYRLAKAFEFRADVR
jgi:hypothetical protein